PGARRPPGRLRRGGPCWQESHEGSGARGPSGVDRPGSVHGRRPLRRPLPRGLRPARGRHLLRARCRRHPQRPRRRGRRGRRAVAVGPGRGRRRRGLPRRVHLHRARL
ncbi:MAG: hypothetical protein AVDCRST_MAG21-532, partial [uncultured Nocardioidaceae bacterium]